MALRATTRWFLGVSATLLAPLALVACGSDGAQSGPETTGGTTGDAGAGATQEPLFQSGSRLRARLLDGGSGAVRFDGFRDTKLDLDCAFHRSDDGKVRCLPPKSTSVEMVYLDAACTQPVALRRCGATEEYMAVEPQQTACDPDDNAYTIYHVGAAVAGAQTYQLLGASACVPGDPTPPGAELRSITMVPAGLFVAATPKVEPRADNLSVRVLQGEDGAREAAAISDDDLHVDCAPHADEIGQLRCAPELSAVAGGPFFEDAACGTPLLADVQSVMGCPAPMFASDSPGSACGDMMGILRVGPKVANSAVYQSVAGVCGQAAFLPPQWSFYERGAAVDPATLAPIDEEKLGKGRLRTPVYAGSDKGLLAQGRGFFDTERGETCLARSFGGGELRCVPDGALRFDLFSDADCKTPLAAVPKIPGCATLAPKVGIVPAAPADPMCSSPMMVDKVYEIGAAYTAATVYTLTGGTCASLDPTQMSIALFTVGPEMDPSKFATVTAKTE